MFNVVRKTLNSNYNYNSGLRSFWTRNFFTNLDDGFGELPLTKTTVQFVRLLLSPRRSKRDLDFKPKKSQNELSLFLNVTGCCARELNVEVHGRYVRVKGVGETLSGERFIDKGTHLPEKLFFNIEHVKGFVQKGQLQLQFPVATKDEVSMSDVLKVVKCVDLPFHSKKEGKPLTVAEAPEPKSELAFPAPFTENYLWMLFGGYIFIQSVTRLLKIPDELNFVRRFQKGGNAGYYIYLDVCGFSAQELKVDIHIVNHERYVYVAGKGQALSGVSKLYMVTKASTDFMFDRPRIRGFVQKGLLQIFIPVVSSYKDPEMVANARIIVPLVDI